MTDESVRARWQALWSRLDAEAEAERLSEAALFNLSKAYRYLLPDEQETVDGVLAEWVLSPDEKKRFDAVALIREHRITSAVPALRELAVRLAASRDVGARFEREKVNGVIDHLAGQSQRNGDQPQKN